MSLNDPQWGRGSTDKESKKESENPEIKESQKEQKPSEQEQADFKPSKSQNDKGGDDLERLWDEFNRALGGMLGQGSQGAQKSRQSQSSKPGQAEEVGSDRTHSASRQEEDFQEVMKRFKQMGTGGPLRSHSNGRGLIFAAVMGIALWGATGFYIVPEGQSGIVTTFGKYTETTMPGFRWHFPIPVQSVEIVDVSSVRTVEVGALGRAHREAEALMLTDDENIVDLRFNVQYRIKPGDGAMNYIFRSKNPDDSVLHSAESAMREVVGRLTVSYTHLTLPTT